jgi:hypothetical protein
MPNLTVAPEDDDSAFPWSHNLESSPRNQVNDSNQRSELERVRLSFDPHKVGFGILPWPGVDQSRPANETSVVAMRYLIDGKDRRDQGDKK